MSGPERQSAAVALRRLIAAGALLHDATQPCAGAVRWTLRRLAQQQSAARAAADNAEQDHSTLSARARAAAKVEATQKRRLEVAASSEAAADAAAALAEAQRARRTLRAEVAEAARRCTAAAADVAVLDARVAEEQLLLAVLHEPGRTALHEAIRSVAASESRTPLSLSHLPAASPRAKALAATAAFPRPPRFAR